MKFHVTAKIMLLVDGKIKSIKAGEIDTADKTLIEALEGAKGVSKVQLKAKAKSKQAD